MKIKDRLLLQFLVLFAILLLGVLASIYVVTDKNRKKEFNTRLRDRAVTVAQLFLAEDNLPSEKFKDVIKKYPQSLQGEIVRIYNKDYQPVFIKDNSYQWPNAIIHEVSLYGYIAYTDGNRQVVGISYRDNSGDFTILISAIDVYGGQAMQQLLRVMLVSFLGSLVITFLIGHFFSRIALYPIKKVIREIRIVRSMGINKRLNETNKGGKDEINELVVSFNNLLEHLEQSFIAQSQFISNASHELRTPLTSIIGTIEVTLHSEREKEDYRKTLELILSETTNLDSLLNSLLELAQANIDVDKLQEVRLDELLWQVKDEYSNNAPVELVYNLTPDSRCYTFSGNRHLLFLAIGNILKNAIKFSDQKPVTCTLSSQHKKTILSIQDQGIGIKEEDNVTITLYSQLGSGTNVIIEFPHDH
jgi:signal transduction histidine kinase